MSPIAIAAAIGGIVTALLTVAGTAVALGKILARVEELNRKVDRMESSNVAIQALEKTVALLQQRQASTEATVSAHDRAIRTLEHTLARHTPDPEG